MTSASADLTASVSRTHSGPVLMVNGKPTAPVTFFVNFDANRPGRDMQLGEVELAGRAGVDIVSFPLAVPWFEEGEKPDFREIDLRMDTALAANPKMLALPRIGLSWPGPEWIEKHKSELMVYADGTVGSMPSIHSAVWRRQAEHYIKTAIAHLESKYPNSVIGYHPCGQNTGEWFYQDLWERRTPGFEPAARQAFRDYLKAKYRTNSALRKAWGDRNADLATANVPTAEQCTTSTRGMAFRDPAAERRVIDFFEFQSAAMADTAALMCRFVKEAAPKKLAVLFYGYHFELSPAIQGMQSGGHLALRRILDSPHVDVLCSPVSYLDRKAGGGGYFMAPVDSVNLHGKLWLIEDDTRTHLAKSDNDAVDPRETAGVLARNFAHILTRGNAVWWMDLMGEGWFSDKAVWQGLSKLRETYDAVMDHLEQYRAEIAVIVDEQSCFDLHPSPQVAGQLIGEFRKQWYRIGAPVGIYLMDDLLAGKVPPAKMYIFVDTFRIDDRQLAAIREHTGANKASIVWMYAPGIIRGGQLDVSRVSVVTGIRLKETRSGDGSLKVAGVDAVFSAGHTHLSPMFAVDDPGARALARYADGGEVAIASKRVGSCTSVYCGTLQLPSSVLREVARQAGVHIYCDTDDVVMSGNGIVAVSASAPGRKTLRLPGPMHAVDCVSGDDMGTASEFSFDMLQGDTRILKVEPARNRGAK